LSSLSRADVLSLLRNGNVNRNAAQSASSCRGCSLGSRADQCAVGSSQGKPEFRFSKCKGEYRTAFFDNVAACRFKVRAVVVRKERVHSPNQREVKESFYKFFIRMMMKHDGKTLVNAKVVIDGSGDREFKKQFRAYLRRHFDTASVRAVDLKDSCGDELIQLADMAVGAIARAYKPDHLNGGRWLEKLRASGHIDNIWEFI
jgi:hypothetical protein